MERQAEMTNGKRVAMEYIDERIADLVDDIRNIQHRVVTLQAKIDDAKEELQVLLQQRGSNWSDTEGYARLVGEGLRVTYETKALDDLIINDPLRYGWLKDYRNESTVRGGVQIR
jgi:hypothetical protein